jgi:hypothetical protein
VVLIVEKEGQVCVWVAAGKTVAAGKMVAAGKTVVSVAEPNFAVPRWNPQEPAKIQHHHLT